MNKRICSGFIFIFLATISAVAQKHPTVSAKDFKNLIGSWHGILNYSGTIIRKPYSTTAELVVKQIGKSNKFEFLNIYTKDPNENIADTITFSKDGRKLNNETIKSKRNTKEGALEIITEVSGFDNDDNKKATLRQTYTIGKHFYVYKKQVKLEGQTDWMERQEFKYERKVLKKEK